MDLTYASENQCAQLGKTILACRIKDLGKPIPKDCVGVQPIINGVPLLYDSGTKVPLLKKLQLYGKPSIKNAIWHVSSMPITFTYFPQPNALEIGFELSIQLMVDIGLREALPSTKIENLLVNHPTGIYTIENLRVLLDDKKWLCGNTSLQADEIEALRNLLNKQFNQIGLVCHKLKLHDAYDVTKTQSQYAEINGLLNQDKKKQTDDATKLSIQEQIIIQDEAFQQYIFKTLPMLAYTLRIQPWPQDQQAFQIQKTLLRRLEHLEVTTNRLPTLKSKISSQSLGEDSMQLLVAECKKASKVVEIVMQLVQETPPNYQEIAQRLDDIEDAIARRRDIWWNVS